MKRVTRRSRPSPLIIAAIMTATSRTREGKAGQRRGRLAVLSERSPARDRRRLSRATPELALRNARNRGNPRLHDEAMDDVSRAAVQPRRRHQRGMAETLASDGAPEDLHAGECISQGGAVVRSCSASVGRCVANDSGREFHWGARWRFPTLLPTRAVPLGRALAKCELAGWRANEAGVVPLRER